MTKNESLFKNISLFFCLVPMLLLSLFCLVPNKDKMEVSAFGDEVLTNFNFVSTNIFIPVTSMNYNNAGAIDRQIITNVVISFGITDGVYSASIDGTMNSVNMSGIENISGFTDNVINLENATSVSPNLSVYLDGSLAIGYKVRVSHSGQLSSDIIKVVYSSYVNSAVTAIRPADYYNTITYFDSNGEYIVFEFPLYNNGAFSSTYRFDERTYYFTTSFDDNAYYQAGYENGYNDGVSDGTNAGYENGYNVGVDVGYGVGFNEGVANTQDYSFLSLIGAVIDAPVSAFTSLLNFNLLGFNMLAFVTGLITLAVILLIVKLFMGGK